MNHHQKFFAHFAPRPLRPPFPYVEGRNSPPTTMELISVRFTDTQGTQTSVTLTFFPSGSALTLGNRGPKRY